jgi:hypothetical protein
MRLKKPDFAIVLLIVLVLPILAVVTFELRIPHLESAPGSITTCPGEHSHDSLLTAARAMLAERFGIHHSTIQIERDLSCEGAAHPPFGS